MAVATVFVGLAIFTSKYYPIVIDAQFFQIMCRPRQYPPYIGNSFDSIFIFAHGTKVSRETRKKISEGI